MELLNYLKPEENVKVIYHYTNLDALIGGILNKEKGKEVCLRATHCQYLNDPSEITSGLNAFEDYFTAVNRLDFDRIMKSSFILSFSESVDSLPMWSMYGKNGKGLKLGFDVNSLKEKIWKCFYEKDLKSLREVLDKSNSKYKIPMILQTPLMIKNDAYSYEKELRMYFLLSLHDKKYKISNGLIVPYIEEFFSKEILKEIWIGPNQDIELSKKSLKMLLDEFGFEHVEIKESKVPYRAD